MCGSDSLSLSAPKYVVSICRCIYYINFLFDKQLKCVIFLSISWSFVCLFDWDRSTVATKLIESKNLSLTECVKLSSSESKRESHYLSINIPYTQYRIAHLNGLLAPSKHFFFVLILCGRTIAHTSILIQFNSIRQHFFCFLNVKKKQFPFTHTNQTELKQSEKNHSLQKYNEIR